MEISTELKELISRYRMNSEIKSREHAQIDVLSTILYTSKKNASESMKELSRTDTDFIKYEDDFNKRYGKSYWVSKDNDRTGETKLIYIDTFSIDEILHIYMIEHGVFPYQPHFTFKGIRVVSRHDTSISIDAYAEIRIEYDYLKNGFKRISGEDFRRIYNGFLTCFK